MLATASKCKGLKHQYMLTHAAFKASALEFTLKVTLDSYKSVAAARTRLYLKSVMFATAAALLEALQLAIQGND